MSRVRGSGGFALVAVLWMLVAVGAAGIAFQAAARAERRAIANARDGVRARWAAHAGLARVLHALDSTLGRGRLGLDGGAPMGMALPPVQFRLNEIAVRARTYDARARVNLNLADERQLVQLFGSLGLDRPQAVSLSAAVLDWRDPDGVVRRGGAEAAAYAARRPPSHPRNGPFTAVAELRGVLGVTPRVYALVAPHVTVVGDGRINVNAASAVVLATLPSLDQAAAAAILARRGTGPFRNAFEVLAALPRQARERIEADPASFLDRIALSPRELEIEVTAKDGGPSGAGELRAIVVLEGGAAVTVAKVEQW
ncbi:MAG: general secretion pathway protein GspK [Gemmatimonadota bacterium]|nr:general secretion pathway protein GspK [Gemmatimonadota bacterium]